MKALASRCLSASGSGSQFWSFSVLSAAQALICSALQKEQKAPPFGTTVICQPLDHTKVKFPEPRSVSGRLLFWDLLSDSCSYLLCPPDDTCDFPYLTKAGVPVDKAPPELLPLPQEEGRKEPQEEQEKSKKVTFDNHWIHHLHR